MRQHWPSHRRRPEASPPGRIRLPRRRPKRLRAEPVRGARVSYPFLPLLPLLPLHPQADPVRGVPLPLLLLPLRVLPLLRLHLRLRRSAPQNPLPFPLQFLFPQKLLPRSHLSLRRLSPPSYLFRFLSALSPPAPPLSPELLQWSACRPGQSGFQSVHTDRTVPGTCPAADSWNRCRARSP